MSYYILKVDAACEEMIVEKLDTNSFDDAIDILKFQQEYDYANTYSLLTEEMYNDLTSGKIKVQNG